MVLTRVIVLHTAPGLGTWIVRNAYAIHARLFTLKASGSFAWALAGPKELDGFVTRLQVICSAEHVHWKAAASFLKCVVGSQFGSLCNPEVLRSQQSTPLGGRAVLILLVLANFLLCACILIIAEIRHLRLRHHASLAFRSGRSAPKTRRAQVWLCQSLSARSCLGPCVASC